MLRRTNINRCTLKKLTNGCARILVLSDVHYGASNCREDYLDEVIDYCLRNNVYLVGLGDYLECSTRSSVGSGVYEQTKRLQDQTEDFIDKLKPLADAGLILGLIEGNHEQRTVKDVDYNPVRQMCRELSTPYMGYGGYYLFTVGKNTYTCYATHGKSNAKSNITKLGAAVRATAHRIVDFVLYGHTHGFDKTSIPLEFIDKRNKSKIKKRKYVILAGSLLDYDNSYADDLGLEPSELGQYVITLGSTKFEMFFNKFIFGE